MSVSACWRYCSNAFKKQKKWWPWAFRVAEVDGILAISDKACTDEGFMTSGHQNGI